MALDQFSDALGGTNEIQIVVTGRTSSRQISQTVWFVQDGDRVYLVPVHGTDTDWYKNLLRNPAITIEAGGANRTATARPITDPAAVQQIVGKFRARYGSGDMERYYSKLDAAIEVPLR